MRNRPSTNWSLGNTISSGDSNTNVKPNGLLDNLIIIVFWKAVNRYLSRATLSPKNPERVPVTVVNEFMQDDPTVEGQIALP